MRRTANRLNTTCVESRGVVRGRAASNVKISCDPFRPCKHRLKVLSNLKKEIAERDCCSRSRSARTEEEEETPRLLREEEENRNGVRKKAFPLSLSLCLWSLSLSLSLPLQPLPASSPFRRLRVLPDRLEPVSEWVSLASSC